MNDLQAVSEMAYQALVLTKAIREDYAETMSKLTNAPVAEIDARIVEKVKAWDKKVRKTL